ncbi:4-hydroxybenzoate 3-monooxygenase [Reinekea sp.]|jgi:p-hydroxybenzoate 3-monooxygenase|uniref:4-hydroxybenzoate 3-monooxygenase n=1 Tax=Reinekea sp. TaxID=1970455 RepID=UPI00338D93B5
MTQTHKTQTPVLKTQVAIIGGGPSGMLLSLLLSKEGIDNVVLERSSRDHVLARIRAGVLEWGSVELLRRAGVGARMDRDGHVHNGTRVAWQGEHTMLIDSKKWTGKSFMAYGQSYVTEDLYAAVSEIQTPVLHDVSDVQLHELTGASHVTFVQDGVAQRLDCDFIAGCDGFHGVSRQAIPASVQKNYEKVYPFGWLGVLSETPPLPDLWYVQHERGFALASQRSAMLSRYYVQCPITDRVEDWSDERFWNELIARFPPEIGSAIITGPSIEKSIAPLRSFVTEPMRYGALFLCGDAAHIVPPTGAKGLNLALSDVYYLWRGLTQHYQQGSDTLLDRYSEVALDRVWKTERFSWWMTSLLHVFPEQSSFDHRTQAAELNSILASEHAQAWLAEQYAGFPVEDWG